MIITSVPNGAGTGAVIVTAANNQNSNGIPFIVTLGSYGPGCTQLSQSPPYVPSWLLTITTTSLPSGAQNTYYTATLFASGGQSPYTWSYSGNLPDRLSLAGSGNNAVISGTPPWYGFNSFTVTVTDTTGARADATLSIAVTEAGPPLTTSSVAYTYDSQGRVSTAAYTNSFGTVAMPIDPRHDLERGNDEVVRDFLMKEVSHGAYEYDVRSSPPLKRLQQVLRD